LFAGERLARGQVGSIGTLALDMARAREMADLGQAVCIAGCPPDRLGRHISWCIANSQPDRVVVACSTYDLCEQIGDECSRKGLTTAVWGRDERFSSRMLETAAVITVPEKLYRLRKQVRDRTYRPRLLFLVDPDAMTLRRSQFGEFDGVRAEAVSIFRATALAARCMVIPIVWTSLAPAAISGDQLARFLSVEAIVYVDGRTIRTAGVAGETQQTAAQEGPNVGALERNLALLRQQSVAVLLVTGQPIATRAAIVELLVAKRHFPQVRLCPLIAQQRSARAQDGPEESVRRSVLESQLRKINKRVVALADLDEFMQRIGWRQALRVISSNVVRTLLVGAMPGWLADEDVREFMLTLGATHGQASRMLFDLAQLRPEAE
jgi:hypothetical protein